MDFKLKLTIPLEDTLQDVLSKYVGSIITADVKNSIRVDVIDHLNTTFVDAHEEEQPDEDSISIMS